MCVSVCAATHCTQAVRNLKDLLPWKVCMYPSVPKHPLRTSNVTADTTHSTVHLYSLYGVLYSVRVFTSLGMCPWYQPWLLMSAGLSFSSSSSSLRSFSGGDSSRYFSLENCMKQTSRGKQDISESGFTQETQDM